MNSAYCWLYSVQLCMKKKISDYGKMLKYREKYRLNDISVDLYLKRHEDE